MTGHESSAKFDTNSLSAIDPRHADELRKDCLTLHLLLSTPPTMFPEIHSNGPRAIGSGEKIQSESRTEPV